MKDSSSRIMYLELKSNQADRGPARIGRVSFSKSGRTIYYDGKSFQKANGVSGNYFDVETGDEYWISGPKRNGEDRHLAGGGIVEIDADAADEYWREIRKVDPPRNPFVV